MDQLLSMRTVKRTGGKVQAIPTYPIIDILVGTTVYGATWADSWGSLAYAAIWLVVLFGAGWITLKRKVASL